MAESSAQSAVERLILTWLQQDHPETIELVEVRPFGSDWAGDTEAGFTTNFRLDLKWRTSDGKTHFGSIEGEEMESLWHYIMRNGTRKGGGSHE